MTSPFDWRGAPSIFSGDKTLKPTKVSGKSMSQLASDKKAKLQAQHGVNPGTIYGIARRYPR